MFHPEQALRMQADLLRETSSPAWLNYATEYAGAMAETHNFVFKNDKARIAKQGRDLLASIIMNLRTAETFVVTEKMTPLVRAAAIDWPDEMKLQPHMLPADSGFMVFERAWDNPGAASEGRDEKVKVVMWRVVGGNVALYEFLSWSEPSEDMLDFYNGLPAEHQRRIRHIGDLELVHMSYIRLGTNMREMLSDADNQMISTRPMQKASGPLAAVFATWALMRQTIVNVNPHRMTPKRFAGFQRKHIPGKVSVITLRHRAAAPEVPGESGRKVGVQFVVRGHWRRVHYGPRGNQTTEWIYIHPHFRGPEDAPLKTSAKVNVLRR